MLVILNLNLKTDTYHLVNFKKEKEKERKKKGFFLFGQGVRGGVWVTTLFFFSVYFWVYVIMQPTIKLWKESAPRPKNMTTNS